jgi:predicted dehydrogenase
VNWGVLGATSRIHRQRLRPAFGLAGQRIVAEASRSGDDTAPYAEVLADPAVEAVYVPLPNSLHVEWVTRALEAGKHVLCEKPLTLSGRDTEALYATAVGAERHLSEAYVWPHHPRAQALMALVSDGGLGMVQAHHAVFTFFLERLDDHRLDDRGGGALVDVGIYCIAPALLLTGREPGSVGATAVRNAKGHDVSMAGWIDLGEGAAASFAVSYDAPARRAQEVIGTGGIVLIDNLVPGPERPGAFVVARPDGSRDEIAFAGANAYERMVTAFAAEATGEQPPRWGAAESIRLAHLLDRLHAASDRN